MVRSFDWVAAVVAVYGQGPVGTGFVISAEGLILTCAHVLDQAGWPYTDWQTPVQVRFNATGEFGRAFVQKDCYQSEDDGDIVLLELDGPLPIGVRFLRLWKAAGAGRRDVEMFGYPAGFRDGLLGQGEVLGLVRQQGRQVLQFRSTETTRGYSGGPVWQPEWERAIGMVQRGIKSDPLGRLAYTTFAAPTEALTALCQKRIATEPPVSRMAEDTRDVSGAMEELFASYEKRVFVGRHDGLGKLNAWLERNTSGRMVIDAPPAVGKTALLIHWIRQREGEGVALAYHFFSRRSDFLRTAAKANANLLRQLAAYYGLYDEPLPNPDLRPSRLRSWVERYGAGPKRRVVILLDALDEAAESSFQLALPNELPEGVFLVVSVRTAEVQQLHESWTRQAHTIKLEPLEEQATVEWLLEANGGALAHMARNSNAVEQLTAKTRGLPLYADLLVEDMVSGAAAGVDLEQMLEQVPAGVEQYVARHVAGLARAEPADVERRLLALLAITPGPFSRDDLAAVTRTEPAKMAAILHQPEIARWLSVSDVGAYRAYSFFHPLLAAEFERALGGEVDEARQMLLDWCAAWREHRRPYALRHFAGLLSRAKRWQELYDLDRDDQFALAQQERVPEEPELPMQTVRLALGAATDNKRAGLMAEFLLLQARRVQALRRESPLEALRTAGGRFQLEYAWHLAHNRDAQRRILWYLLLAWELFDSEASVASEATLEQLKTVPLVVLPSPWSKLAALPLVRLSKHGPKAACEQLCDHLGDAVNGRIALLASRDQLWDLALDAARRVSNLRIMVYVRSEVAKAQARHGLDKMALATLAPAIEAVPDIDEKRERSKALRDMAAAQAEAGEYEEALATADAISAHKLRASAQSQIAAVQIEAGRTEDAQDTLARAQETAQKLGPGLRRSEAMAEIVATKLEAADLAGALEIARSQMGDPIRGPTLVTIAVSQAKSSDVAAAFATVDNDLWEAKDRAEALAGIAAIQANAGDGEPARETFESALEYVDKIPWEWQKVEARQKVAAAFAKAGDIPAARETLESIGYPSVVAETLAGIASALIATGRKDAVKEIASLAREAAAGSKEKWARIRTLESLITTYIWLDDLPSAQALAQGIDDDEKKLQALAEIAAAYDEKGETAAARTAVAAVLEMADVSEREETRNEGLKEIAVAQAGEGKIVPALDTAAHIGAGASKVGALQAIAVAQARKGDEQGSLATFSMALEAIDSAAATWRGQDLMKELAAAQAEAGHISAALQTAESLPKDFFRRAGALAAVASALARSGEIKAARSALDKAVELAGTAGTGKSFMVEAMVTLGDLRAAQAEAVRIFQPELRAVPLATVASSLAQVGDKEASDRYLSEAQNLAESITDKRVRAFAQARIAVAQAEAGRTDASEKSFAAAMATAESIVSEHIKAGALASVAIAQVEAGLDRQAAQTAASILTEAHRYLPQIGLALAKGNYEQSFGRVLNLPAAVPGAAPRLCGAIARLYPQRAAEVAQMVLDQRWE